ncbi:MAG: bifunctional riboflavin kinase/FAD synthetase [Acidimicrobiaceae bacterium]|nr:bifunctional riboflavin kinase/FAD synthetase [Acidimicrobiaceae bacterium]
MEVVRPSPGAEGPSDGCVATIGAFDGVHLGHRRVIAQVRRLAAERGVPSAVVTFDRHPASVVRPESAPGLLTDLDQKLDLLAETGVDYTVVVHFDQERAHESAEDFVATVLVGFLHVRAVIVGADFHFGYRRAGNVALLEKLGAAEPTHSLGGTGFDVIGVDLFDELGRSGADAVSSTRIRQLLLREGDVAGAARLLGRFHQVRGVVVHGDRRGGVLGFPTANIAVPAEVVVPADGVYAGWYVRPDGLRRPAALSVGGRPTFYDDADLSLLEAYLLDFDGDLYGEEARVSFVARVRDQRRYESLEELVEQMARDVDATRRILADEGA